jgi:hypothetical protein
MNNQILYVGEVQHPPQNAATAKSGDSHLGHDYGLTLTKFL